MKKKIFAALAAALMLGTTLAAPVSAAETEYRLGDVNLDGRVDVADAQLILVDYVALIVGKKGILTDQQRALGNVDEIIDVDHVTKAEYEASVIDSYWILSYYCAHLVDSNIQMKDVLGKEPIVSDAIKEFLQKYTFVYDEQSGEYSIIER